MTRLVCLWTKLVEELWTKLDFCLQMAIMDTVFVMEQVGDIMVWYTCLQSTSKTTFCNWLLGLVELLHSGIISHNYTKYLSAFPLSEYMCFLECWSSSLWYSLPFIDVVLVLPCVGMSRPSPSVHLVLRCAAISSSFVVFAIIVSPLLPV